MSTRNSLSDKQARMELRVATNAYRRAVRFARACSTLQLKAADAEVAERRIEMARARNRYKGL